MKTSDEDKERIIKLYFEDNLNFVEISKITSISRITVSNIIKKYREKSNIDKTIVDVNYKSSYYKGKKKVNRKAGINIPKNFLEDIGINENERKAEITVYKDKKEIKIRKVNED